MTGLMAEEIIDLPIPSNEKVSHPRGFFVFSFPRQSFLEDVPGSHRELF